MRIWPVVAEMVGSHGSCALVTVAAVRGSAPREPGARMVIAPDGGFRGTIGGGELEWRAIGAARDALSRNTPAATLTRFTLGPDLGQCCGGSVQLLTEVFDRDRLDEIQALAAREAAGPFVTRGRIGPRSVERIVDEEVAREAPGPARTGSFAPAERTAGGNVAREASGPARTGCSIAAEHTAGGNVAREASGSAGTGSSIAAERTAGGNVAREAPGPARTGSFAPAEHTAGDGVAYEAPGSAGTGSSAPAEHTAGNGVAYEASGSAGIGSFAPAEHTAGDGVAYEAPGSARTGRSIIAERTAEGGVAHGDLPVEHGGLPVELEGDGVIVERFHDPRRPLWLFGAGHVGRALMLALAPLPFDVTWIDEREGTFPAATPANVRPVRSADAAGELTGAPDGAFVVVMTHSHALDLAIVHAALAAGRFGYVGLIGSAGKRARFVRRLREAGVAEARVATLVCPIGMPAIRSKHPAAIAARRRRAAPRTRRHVIARAPGSMASAVCPVRREGRVHGNDSAFCGFRSIPARCCRAVRTGAGSGRSRRPAASRRGPGRP